MDEITKTNKHRIVLEVEISGKPMTWRQCAAMAADFIQHADGRQYELKSALFEAGKLEEEPEFNFMAIRIPDPDDTP